MKNIALHILIVDDHPLVRHGLATAMEAEDDLRVLAQAESLKDAVDCLRTMRPDVMVLDLNLKDGNRWRFLEELSATGKLLPTLVLSVNDELAYGRRLLQEAAAKCEVGLRPAG